MIFKSLVLSMMLVVSQASDKLSKDEILLESFRFIQRLSKTQGKHIQITYDETKYEKNIKKPASNMVIQYDVLSINC